MNNPMQMLSQFPQFMNQYRGQNPDQILQQMLSTGRISQQQLNEAQSMAKKMAPQMEQFRYMFGFNR